MCDYSLMHLASRDAQVGDKLITKDFGSGTKGFAPVSGEDVAVCVRPGTEIAFDSPIERGMIYGTAELAHCTAIFRQVNKDVACTHHDQLELPDGSTVMLTQLKVGQTATILQLPATPQTEAEADEQRRVEVVA